MGTMGLPPLSPAHSADVEAAAEAMKAVAGSNGGGAVVQLSAADAHAAGVVVAPSPASKLAAKKVKKSSSFSKLLDGLGKRRGSSNSLAADSDQASVPASAAPSPRDRCDHQRGALGRATSPERLFCAELDFIPRVTAH